MSMVTCVMFGLQENSAEGADKKDKDKNTNKKKQLIKAIELPIESSTAGFSQVILNSYVEQECKMIAGV